MYLDVDGVVVVWDDAHSCIELARGFGRLMRFCLLQDIKYFGTNGREDDSLLKFMDFAARRLKLPAIADWHADFEPPVGPGPKPI